MSFPIRSVFPSSPLRHPIKRRSASLQRLSTQPVVANRFRSGYLEEFLHGVDQNGQMQALVRTHWLIYSMGTPALQADPKYQALRQRTLQALERTFGSPALPHFGPGLVVPPTVRDRCNRTFNGLLGQITIDFIRYLTTQYQPQDGVEARYLLLWATDAVNNSAMDQASEYALQDFELKFDGGIQYPHHKLAGYGHYKHNIQSALAVRHFLFTNQEGGLLILQQPPAEILYQILLQDAKARQHMMRSPSLIKDVALLLDAMKTNGPPPPLPCSRQSALSDDETLALLQGQLQQDHHPMTLSERKAQNDWDDTHTLWHYVPIDVEQAIRKRIWSPQVLFNLPGADGKSVFPVDPSPQDQQRL